MAGYADILRDGIALVDEITATLQCDVTIKRYIGQSDMGTPVFDTPDLTVPAIVDKKFTGLRGKVSQEAIVQAYIGILRPIADVDPTHMLPGFTRVNPIDDNDVIILPDGSTGPILSPQGFFDADTNRPYFTEVLLGWSRSLV